MNIFSSLLSGLWQAALPALATAAGAFVVKVLASKARQANVDLTAAQEDRLKRLVQDAILAVEERAVRNPNMTGVEKHAVAKAIVLDRNSTVSPEEVDRLIDTQLPLVRATLKPSTPSTFGK